MKFLMKPNVLMILLLAVVFQVRAEVKMPALFANNAILQQKSEVAIVGLGRCQSNSGSDSFLE